MSNTQKQFEQLATGTPYPAAALAALYDEYAEAEEAHGRAPLPPAQWLTECDVEQLFWTEADDDHDDDFCAHCGRLYEACVCGLSAHELERRDMQTRITGTEPGNIGYDAP